MSEMGHRACRRKAVGERCDPIEGYVKAVTSFRATAASARRALSADENRRTRKST
ncbi:hypothetical protein [Polaromonas jejuensis]|uniref:Uncharacterized protein n=1 Tax=Polaromonas jejuensis TaxID=457502 RepID=A0ABW0QE20_9BURK|nr:hypothetical protein [Polaromonas jejuensis]